jgi:lipopolysaccharide transport system permease protein
MKSDCRANMQEFSKQTILLLQLVRRDVILRYRGALFGALWLFLSPLLMLAILAFVLGTVFQARWPEQQGEIPLWLTLFTGLIVFNIFSETVSRAPTSVRAHPNYIKKMIFPVHILPMAPMGAALIQALFNFALLIIALAWVGHLHLQIILIPILILPLGLLILGLSWFISAWGVFIKDLTQIVPLLVQMMLFLSPVLYPVSAVPEMIQPFYRYNPLGSIIEICRSAAFGQDIDWHMWAVVLVIGFVFAVVGYLFFQHAREEFADVL